MIDRKPESENKFTTGQKTVTPAAVAFAALVFVLLMLLTPGPVIEAIKNWLSLPVMPPSESEFPVDKVVHCLMFAVCGFLSARAWAERSNLLVIVLAMLIYAGITELLQRVVPGRSGDVTDFFADAVGVVMGVWWFYRLNIKKTRLARAGF